MNWYEVLLAVERHKSVVQDISTGDPFLLPEVTIELLHSIERMAQHDGFVAFGTRGDDFDAGVREFFDAVEIAARGRR